MSPRITLQRDLVGDTVGSTRVHMITGIGLRNFKRYGKRGAYFPLGSRLTLILGPNSCGKSTCIQALLMLKQSWREPKDWFAIRPEGSEVRLGDARNVVHLQRQDSLISLLFEHRTGVDGSLRRLWVEALPAHRGAEALVERWRLELPKDAVASFGRQPLGENAGVLGVWNADGDEPKAGIHGTRPVSVTIASEGVPAGVHPLIDRWLKLRVALPSGLTLRPEDFLGLGVAVSEAKEGGQVVRLRSQLEPRPPEPEFPAVPERSALLDEAPTQASEESDEAFEERRRRYLDADKELTESLSRHADDLFHYTSDKEDWVAAEPYWEEARRLADLIGDPLLGKDPEGLPGQLEIPSAINVPAAVSDVTQAVQSLRYLGPVRNPATRWVSSGASVDSVGNEGERTVELLLQHARLSEDGDRPVWAGPLLDAVNKALRDIGVGYALEVWGTDPAAGPPAATLRLVQAHVGGVVRVGLQDVGSGIRQVLPILVEYEYLRSKLLEVDVGVEVPLLAVEQPELHLHPRLQGDLLMWLAGMERRPISALDEEGDAPADIEPTSLEQAWRRRPGLAPQVILETHGEVLTLRAARLARSTLVESDDELVCLAVSNGGAEDEGEPVVTRVRKGPRGWVGWPSNLGFFAERLDEREDG